MKILTLTQPWATLVALGFKTFETRPWNTKYRGRIGIHAAKGFPAWARELFYTEPFSKFLLSSGYHTPVALPIGKILCTVEISETYPTNIMHGQIGANELAFGDYTPGRFAFRLKNRFVLHDPIPAKGMLGLWEFPLDDGYREAVL